MRVMTVWFLVLSLASCAPMMGPAIEPGKKMECPDGSSIITIDCTTDLGLKQRVISANASIPQVGIGIGGSYEEKAIGQITDSTYQLALRLESLCKNFNACMMPSEQYLAEARTIRLRLNEHVTMANELKDDKSVGDKMWTNAVPELAAKRIEMKYGVLARPKDGGEIAHHTNGAPLHTGDGLQFTAEINQPAYVYILLLSSTGEASLLFPQPDIGLQNPLPAGKEIRIPKGADMFELDDKTGTETFQILASAKPLPDIEQRLANLGKGRDSSAKLEQAIGGRICEEDTELRGVKLKKAAPPCDPKIGRRAVLVESGKVAARPNDDIIIYQHVIEHQ
jgi:hypothetical protein